MGWVWLVGFVSVYVVVVKSVDGDSIRYGHQLVRRHHRHFYGHFRASIATSMGEHPKALNSPLNRFLASFGLS